MSKYVVQFHVCAYQNLNGIYTYITENPLEPATAINMINEQKAAIWELGQFPEYGALRRAGSYVNGNQRQLFVKNCIMY